LTQELTELGFIYIEYTGSKDETQGILSVTVYDRDSKAIVKQFNPTQNVRFEIETKTKPKPVPKPTPKKEDKTESVTVSPSQGSSPSPGDDENTNPNDVGNF